MVSLKTLRYYDQIGILKLGKVDHDTGYRYYSADQLLDLNRILQLQFQAQMQSQSEKTIINVLPPRRLQLKLLLFNKNKLLLQKTNRA